VSWGCLDEPSQQKSRKASRSLFGASERLHGGLFSSPSRWWFGSAPAQGRFAAGAGCGSRSGRTPDTPDWPMLPQSGHSPSRSSREPSEPPDPRSLDGCAAGPAGGAVWSRRIFWPPVGDTRREWYRVWRDARPAPVLGVLNACRFPPGWPARHRRAASLAADAP